MPTRRPPYATPRLVEDVIEAGIDELLSQSFVAKHVRDTRADAYPIAVLANVALRLVNKDALEQRGDVVDVLVKLKGAVRAPDDPSLHLHPPGRRTRLAGVHVIVPLLSLPEGGIFEVNPLIHDESGRLLLKSMGMLPQATMQYNAFKRSYDKLTSASMRSNRSHTSVASSADFFHVSRHFVHIRTDMPVEPTVLPAVQRWLTHVAMYQPDELPNIVHLKSDMDPLPTVVTAEELSKFLNPTSV